MTDDPFREAIDAALVERKGKKLIPEKDPLTGDYSNAFETPYGIAFPMYVEIEGEEGWFPTWGWYFAVDEKEFANALGYENRREARLACREFVNGMNAMKESLND